MKNMRNTQEENTNQENFSDDFENGSTTTNSASIDTKPILSGKHVVAIIISAIVIIAITITLILSISNCANRANRQIFKSKIMSATSPTFKSFIPTAPYENDISTEGEELVQETLPDLENIEVDHTETFTENILENQIPTEVLTEQGFQTEIQNEIQTENITEITQIPTEQIEILESTENNYNQDIEVYDISVNKINSSSFNVVITGNFKGFSEYELLDKTQISIAEGNYTALNPTINSDYTEFYFVINTENCSGQLQIRLENYLFCQTISSII